MKTKHLALYLLIMTIFWGCSEDSSDTQEDGEDSSDTQADSVDQGDNSFLIVEVQCGRTDTPLTNRTVGFHDADGKLIGTDSCDESGVARGQVPEDGMVTFFYLSIYGSKIYTILRIEPDSSLSFLVGSEPEAVSYGRIRIASVPEDEPEDLYDYNLHYGTVYPAVSRGRNIDNWDDLGVSDNLVSNDGTLDLVLLGMTSDDQPIAYAALRDVPILQEGTTEISFTDWMEETPQTMDIEVRGIRDAERFGECHCTTVVGKVTLGHEGVFSMHNGGIATCTALSYPGLADYLVVSSAVTESSGPHRSRWRVMSPDENPMVLDFSEPPLGFASDSTIDYTDFENVHVSWTMGDDIHMADALYIRTIWHTEERDFITWIGVGPTDLTSVTLPEFPEDLQHYDISHAETDNHGSPRIEEPPQIYYVNFAGIEGYSQVIEEGRVRFERPFTPGMEDRAYDSTVSNPWR